MQVPGMSQGRPPQDTGCLHDSQLSDGRHRVAKSNRLILHLPKKAGETSAQECAARRGRHTPTQRADDGAGETDVVG